jgi:hypothetical protein
VSKEGDYKPSEMRTPGIRGGNERSLELETWQMLLFQVSDDAT